MGGKTLEELSIVTETRMLCRCNPHILPLTLKFKVSLYSLCFLNVSLLSILVFSDNCCLRISLFIRYSLDTNLIQLWSFSVVKTRYYLSTRQGPPTQCWEAEKRWARTMCLHWAHLSLIHKRSYPRGWPQPLTRTWACVFDSTLLLPSSQEVTKAQSLS